MSTIGYERRTNPFLSYQEFGAFKKFVREGAPPEPHHYKHLKRVNAAGQPLIGHAPVIPALTVPQFLLASEQTDCQLVDTRQMLAI